MISSINIFPQSCHHNSQTPVFLLFFSVLAAFFTVRSPSAQPNVYNQMAGVDSIMKTFHIDYCCNSTIAECIEEKPQCTITDHLYRFADWLSGFNAPPDSISKYMRIRYESLTESKTNIVDTAHMQRAGKADAPIVVVAYISANCPSCKRYVGDLYDSVTIGSLKGKAMLYAKPFGQSIGNRALVAAAAEGTFWKFFLALREKRGLLKKDEDVLHIADSLGIASKSFVSHLNAPETTQQLKANKKEGKRLNVKYTPAFFINSKRYTSHKRSHWIADAVLFELEKSRKQTHK